MADPLLGGLNLFVLPLYPAYGEIIFYLGGASLL
jgi:hypothetical protein